MSLSALLLGSKLPIDSELDGLFKTTIAQAPEAVPTPGPSKETSHKKRKRDAAKDVVKQPSKRVRAVSEDEPSESPAKVTKKTGDTTSKASKGLGEVEKKKKNKKGEEKEVKPVVEDEDDSDDNSDLENAYLNEKAAPRAIGDDDADSDGDLDTSPPVHESLQKDGKKRAKTVKKKHIPQDETPELRDQRTIFVGNLPLEVASKNPLKKQLQHHIISFVPSAKIESVRFRSIPFKTPTSKLPTSDDEESSSKPKPKPKEPRAHEKERASVWKSKLDEKDEATVKADEKKYMNPAQKKKVAFINQEFHTTADTVNAYVVFAHPVSTEDRPANLPPLPPTMDPYEAAISAAAQADGSLFMDRMLRVDLVGKGKASSQKSSTVDADKHALLEADPRLSVFVGNLEFASKEEDLRVFFEGVLGTERGPPLPKPQDGDEESTDSKKPLTWVTRVRIVRDKDTQLGKGFAYVQFADRECVDEVLAMEEDKLKFAKRKLRVQRCKTLPGSKQLVGSTSVSNSKQAKPAHVPVIIPKGDPALGEKLAGLPKEERKKLKSTDTDRVARRLAKKKARMALALGVGKTSKPLKKERKRVRS